MSSPQNNELERIIPIEDAPAPLPRSGESHQSAEDSGAGLSRQSTEGAAPDLSRQSAEGAAPDAFTRDPLNTLKFTPLIVEAVSKVFDPEIPVNIYELGLIYDIDVDSAANVAIKMTLTAPACPAAQTIPLDVERRVREVPGVNDVKVAVVWDPPWTRDRMSEAAKLTLGML